MKDPAKNQERANDDEGREEDMEDDEIERKERKHPHETETPVAGDKGKNAGNNSGPDTNKGGAGDNKNTGNNYDNNKR